MERRQGRRIGPEEKLRILEEGRKSGTSVSEVCRRNQIAATQFYDWERRAREGALEALARKGRRGHDGAGEGALHQEISRLREVIVALSAENVSMKRGPS